jgi:predicted ATPase
VGCATLLEREQSLAQLADWWSQACGGHGCVALIAGEAGIGKTALVREFERRVSGRKLLGLCEPSSTPRPLGPLIDMAPQLGGAVAQHLAAGERAERQLDLPADDNYIAPI